MTYLQKEKIISLISFTLGLAGIVGGIYALLFYITSMAVALLVIASLNVGYSSCRFFQIYEKEQEIKIQQLKEEYFEKSFKDINKLIQKATPSPEPGIHYGKEGELPHINVDPIKNNEEQIR